MNSVLVLQSLPHDLARLLHHLLMTSAGRLLERVQRDTLECALLTARIIGSQVVDRSSAQLRAEVILVDAALTLAIMLHGSPLRHKLVSLQGWRRHCRHVLSVKFHKFS